MFQRCGHQSQRTTYTFESFHTKFKNNLNHSHLNSYALVEAIKTVEIDACIAIKSSKNLKHYTKKVQDIATILGKFTKIKQISRPKRFARPKGRNICTLLPWLGRLVSCIGGVRTSSPDQFENTLNVRVLTSSTMLIHISLTIGPVMVSTEIVGLHFWGLFGRPVVFSLSPTRVCSARKAKRRVHKIGIGWASGPRQHKVFS